MMVVNNNSVTYGNNRRAINGYIGKSRIFGGVFGETLQRDDESYSDNSISSSSDDSSTGSPNKNHIGRISRRLGSFAESLIPSSSSSRDRSYPMLIPSESDSSSCSSSSDSDVSLTKRHQRVRRGRGFGKIKTMQKKAVKLISSVPQSPNKHSKNKNLTSSTDELTSLINSNDDISSNVHSPTKVHQCSKNNEKTPDLTTCHTDETDEISSSSSNDSCCSTTSGSSSDGDYFTSKMIVHTHWINKQGSSMSLLPVVREEEEDITDENNELNFQRRQNNIIKEYARSESSHCSRQSSSASYATDYFRGLNNSPAGENNRTKSTRTTRTTRIDALTTLVKVPPTAKPLTSPDTTSYAVANNSYCNSRQRSFGIRENKKKSRQSSKKSTQTTSSNSDQIHEELNDRLKVILTLKDIIMKQKKQIKVSDKALALSSKKLKNTKRIIGYLRKIHHSDRHKISQLQSENEQLVQDVAFYREHYEKLQAEQQNNSIIIRQDGSRDIHNRYSKEQRKKQEIESATIEMLEKLNKLRKLEISMSKELKQWQQLTDPSPKDVNPVGEEAASLDISFLKYIDENTKSIKMNVNGDVLEVLSQDDSVVRVGSKSVLNKNSCSPKNKITNRGTRRLNRRIAI